MVNAYTHDTKVSKPDKAERSESTKYVNLREEVQVGSRDTWLFCNAEAWASCETPLELSAQPLLRYIATGETGGDRMIEDLDREVEVFNMNEDNVMYAMSDEDLDARDRAEDIIEAKLDGMAIGRADERRLINKLNHYLIDEGMFDELSRATADEEYQKALYDKLKAEGAIS